MIAADIEYGGHVRLVDRHAVPDETAPELPAPTTT
jgi:hypothetical protein